VNESLTPYPREQSVKHVCVIETRATSPAAVAYCLESTEFSCLTVAPAAATTNNVQSNDKTLSSWVNAVGLKALITDN